MSLRTKAVFGAPLVLAGAGDSPQIPAKARAIYLTVVKHVNEIPGGDLM